MELKSEISRWWLPASPDTRHDGHLSVNREGRVELVLFGTLSGSPFAIQELEPEILHGLSRDGRHFTARRLMWIGATNNMPGFPTVTYRAGSLIVGRAFVDESQLYDEAIVEITFLRDWIGLSGMNVDWEAHSEAEPPTLSFRYRHPPDQAATLSQGASVRTWTSLHAESTPTGLAQTEDVALKITADTALPVDELISRFVTPLRDLVTFATAHNNWIDRLTIRSSTATTEGGTNEHRSDFEFIAEWMGRYVHRSERLLVHDMVFGMSEAPVDFQSLIQNWFDLGRDVRVGLAPFLGSVYAPPAYMNQQLVSIAQTLEAYHREWAKSGSKLAPLLQREQFTAVRDAALAAGPPELRETLRTRLGYLNQPLQVQRWTELVERVELGLASALSRRPDFVDKFNEARNRETHRESGEAPMSDRALYDLTRTASYVFTANVMCDLGFTNERIAELFERNREFAHFSTHPLA